MPQLEQTEMIDDVEWENEEELPPRPRRRLLAPLPVALLVLLFTALGFWGGVEVQKHHGSSASASGFGGRAGFSGFSGAGRSGSTGSSSASVRTGATSSFPGAAGAGASGSGFTSGEVKYVSGDTLYVSNSSGNVVKVRVSDSSKVTKTVTTHVSSIHPGETVVVQGTTDSSGAVTADSISIGSSGLATGLGALSGASESSTSSSSTGTSSTPALFGNG